MPGEQKDLIVLAVDAFLNTAKTMGTTNASYSARVPQALKIVLRNIATQLREKAPSREYTALQIASIIRVVYDKHATPSNDDRLNLPKGMETESCPEILKSMRAFGRFLQKHGGPEIGFEASGRVNNRRTYRPVAYNKSPLDT